jgi:hypothetical protein
MQSQTGTVQCAISLEEEPADPRLDIRRIAQVGKMAIEADGAATFN